MDIRLLDVNYPAMSNKAKENPRSERPSTVLMLLSNAYDPDPRVRQEALALIGMGCRVRLLAWDRDLKAPAYQCMEGVEVERVFLSSTHGRGTIQLFFYALLYLTMFWRGLRTRFDVVHCHDLDTLPLGFLLGKLKRKRIVYDAHESFTDMLVGNVHPTVLRALALIETLLIRRIDLLITVGEKLRRHFEQRGARHSVVLGNWKRPADFIRSESHNMEVRRKLGIPAASLVVVCITQLLLDRKLEELLLSIEKCPNVYVIVGGKGVLEERVKAAAAANPRIIYVGFVSSKQIANLTCASDAVYYGFDPANPNARFSAPNKLYEATAAGRPVITGDFGEIADVVRTEKCGIILSEYSVEEIQRALSALEDRDVRHAMAVNSARAGRARMNWEKGKKILYREYSTLLRQPLKEPGPTEIGDATILAEA